MRESGTPLRTEITESVKYGDEAQDGEWASSQGMDRGEEDHQGGDGGCIKQQRDQVGRKTIRNS